jgi:AcrR family transcriptional regulator
VVLVYHDSMRVPRQGETAESGRVNQKRRTRAAIVEAARALFSEGVTPTVAQAAERALVSRTTAYRYFPTQEALLLEIVVTTDVDEIEDLVATPVEAASAPQRVVDVVNALNTRVFAEEAQYRRMLRLYLDVWLQAHEQGETEPVVREGRRTRWFDHTLEPLRDSVDPSNLARLTAALCLVTGSEAMVALRDVARLSSDDAQRVAAWAAQVLVRATVES